MPVLASTDARGVRLQADLHAQRFQDIGGAALEEAERLPCLATGTPAGRHHKGDGGGDIEGAQPVAAGAAQIDRAGRRGDGAHMGAHGA